MVWDNRDFKFQPTPPARTETMTCQLYRIDREISTHSAREDGDFSRLELILAYINISTHSAREDGVG